MNHTIGGQSGASASFDMAGCADAGGAREHDRLGRLLDERTREVARLMQTLAQYQSDWEAKGAALRAEAEARERRFAANYARLEAEVEQARAAVRRAELVARLATSAANEAMGKQDSLHTNRLVRWLMRAGLVKHQDPVPQQAKVVRESGLFDAVWYATSNPDVAQTPLEPVEHYLRYGAREGRNPSAQFDSYSYLLANPDIAEAGINPLLHYALYGRNEGRALK